VQKRLTRSRCCLEWWVRWNSVLHGRARWRHLTNAVEPLCAARRLRVGPRGVATRPVAKLTPGNLAVAVQSLYGSVFSVNGSSGDVVVRGRLDYERQRRYSVIIVARDGLAAGQYAALRLSTHVQLTVSVADVNDCPPHITINSLSSRGLADVRYIRNSIMPKFHWTSFLVTSS